MDDVGRSRGAGDGRSAGLRRAAVASHWLPDVGILIVSAAGSPVRVASWQGDEASSTIDLHPCQFRRILVRAISADECGLAGLLDGVVEIRTITGPCADLGLFGLIRLDLDDGRGVLALVVDGPAEPVVVEAERGRVGQGDSRSTGDGCDMVGLGFDHDAELDATLVHACFDAGDALAEQQVFEALVDIAAADAATTLVEAVGGSVSSPDGDVR